MFSITAKAYNTSDVFNTQELLVVMSQSDTISEVMVNGNMISNWRDAVSQKYSKLPGIRVLHDFLIVRNPTSRNAMMIVRDFCHEGAPKPTTMTLNSGTTSEFNCFPTPKENYVELGRIRTLPTTKLNHLRQMSNNNIPMERWFDFLK